jgi:UDP-N-acetyl-D-mannosaminuronic acid dehydrogenase
VNDSKPEWVLDKVKIAVAELLQKNPLKTAYEITIACFGLAFKPDIDDLRESPAVSITQKIAAFHPGRVLAVEPHIEELPAKLTNQLTLSSIDHALPEADVIVLLVDHKFFKEISLEQLENRKLIDTRGIWNS